MTHKHTAYREDNIDAWDIVRDSIHDNKAFYWYNRCKQGRGELVDYIVLKTH